MCMAWIDLYLSPMCRIRRSCYNPMNLEGEIMKTARILILTIIALAMSGLAMGKDNLTDKELRWGFDECARNFGAVEYATYTYMVEFHKAPASLQELRDTGHLNVLMVNPYSGAEVKSLGPDDYPDGDLAGNIYIKDRDESREAHEEIWYVRPNDQTILHSMVKRIYLYTSSLDHQLFFDNDLPRDEQFVAVYCRQAVDALESFQQKIGTSPDNFEDMYNRGDVNVHYINPITGELAVSSEELSVGNFFYKKEKDNGYTLIGWGRTRPVFFASTDEDASNAFYQIWPGLADEIEAE
jgi:hypothetical protein